MTTIDLPRDTTLERVADSLAILASAKASEMPMDWPTLARLVKTGGAKSILSVGDLIEEAWIDKSVTEPKEYSLPWGVRHFGQVELADGTTVDGMYLETHYLHLKGVPFSAPRAFLKCPEGLSAGTYHFTFEASTGKYVVAGESVCFTLTQDVPAGGRLGGLKYIIYDTPKDKWKVTSYGANGIDVIETVPTAFEVAEGSTDLGIMKVSARNGNLNSVQETSYGWNRWATSAMRQYLNSSADKGTWWVAQDGWDIAPDQLSQIPGFLSGVPQEMIDAMLPVKTRTYLNTVNDTTEYGAEYDDTYDKVFISSLGQLNINYNQPDEGDTWDYWKLIAGKEGKFPPYKDTPELVRYKTENRTSSDYCRLRSAFRGLAFSTWSVSLAGLVYSSHSAYHAFRPCPACVIGKI